MRSGIVIIIGRPCTDSTNMVSETFSREVARSACPNGLRAEHEAKIALLRKLNIAFMEFDMPEGAPNGIYTRDPAAFSALGRVLFCNMRHPERRPEVQVFKNSIGTQNRQICVPETFCVADRGGPDAFLEGGDIMQFDDHGKHRVVLFLSRRSNHQGIEVGKLFFEWEGYRVDVVESAELHGTSAISVIGNNTVLVNPAKIDLHAIQRLGVKTLLVPERERDTLAANVAWYPVGNCNASRDVVVCNSDHMETADMLDQAGYQVERIPFANHHLAEGNTDCAMGQRFATCFG